MTTNAEKRAIDSLRALERAKYTERYFQQEYWKEDIPGQTGNRGLSYNDPGHRRRFAFLADLLKAHFQSHSFIDAGCGPGLLLNELHLRGLRATGFEISEAATRMARQLTPDLVLFRATVDAIPVLDSSVDCVLCFDVLEHLPVFDVASTVCELARVAKRYVIATINLDNPYYYHPTILSRQAWDALFSYTGELVTDSQLQTQLQSECRRRYEEYDWFVYQKRSHAAARQEW